MAHRDGSKQVAYECDVFGQLSEADATWTVDAVASVPDGDDWVLVLGDHVDAGHWRLQDLSVGERFAFGGRVFESGVVEGELVVRATGDVLGRVVDTFVRMAPEVIDAEIAYTDGSTDALTGTPNHPFWVDAVRDYVPLGELEVGTVLHVQGGGEAILVSKTWRQGDFEVFDFEVEGLHNFYVRGPGSDAAGVLVHNSTGRMSGVPAKGSITPHPDAKVYERPSRAGPTAAQKRSVQGQPCVDCGAVTPKQVADHKDPLVVQNYRDGAVDVEAQRQLDAVQPHCPTCSNKQGGQLGAFGKEMKKAVQERDDGQ